MQLFTLPDGVGIDELERALAGTFLVDTDAELPFQRTFFDTFDRRVSEACDGLPDRAVERDVDGTESIVRWIDPDGHELTSRCSTRRRLRFAEDLPTGRLRDALTPVLGPRALLPMVVVQGELQRVRVTDRERKTVVRVALYRLQAIDSEERCTATLPTQLEIRPVRGYDRELKRLTRALRRDCGPVPAKPLLLQGLGAIGRRTFGHSTHFGHDIDPDTPAHRALRKVLLSLSATIRANEPGVRARLDTEFLHDLRVAVRRTRSALQRFRGLLPEEQARRFADGFAWIGRATNPSRDLDVHLLEFDEHAARLEENARTHLEPLRDLLYEESDRAHATLVAALDSEGWRRQLDDWEAWLRLEPHPHELLAEGARPIAEVAAERAAALHRKLLRRGRAIDEDTPAEALHDLRKLGKKLRYALELFRGVYPPDDYRRAIRTMKVLQDNLGDFQDYEVQQDALAGLGKQLLDSRRGAADTLLVMGRIIDDLARRQRATRRRFAQCFASIDTAESRELFDALFQAALEGVGNGPDARRHANERGNRRKSKR